MTCRIAFSYLCRMKRQGKGITVDLTVDKHGNRDIVLRYPVGTVRTRYLQQIIRKFYIGSSVVAAL